MVVGVEPGLKGKREVDLKGQSVVPGFIDAHVHIESSLMTPGSFQASVLPLGTTSAVCDPHELANVKGARGIEYFLNAAEKTKLDLHVMMSSCVPATHFETNGGGSIEAETLVRLGRHPHALGLAEVMNVPAVLNGDRSILAKLKAFEGRPLDGHCPLLRGQQLSAYASAGISSCHESSELEEAREKLSKGISVWIREGSVAKDVDALAPLLNLATSSSVGFCTDDRNPLDISEEGHINYLIRRAIALGVQPEVAYRASAWSVARHYGLDRGFRRQGAIAPGYLADLVVLGDVKTASVDRVLKSGQWVHELDLGSLKLEDSDLKNSVNIILPEASDLEAQTGKAHVMGVIPGKIITEHLILPSTDAGVARISVLERYGNKSKPSNAYVKGFGVSLKGAIASSVGHDSHNLIVVGSNSKDMRVALAALAESGGGFCVVQNEKVIALLELPLGGLMCADQPNDLKRKLVALRAASRSIGCELADPFLQLAFLSLPVIPALKLTDRGLFDVERFEPISVIAN